MYKLMVGTSVTNTEIQKWFKITSQNVTVEVEWHALMLCILEMPTSILSPVSYSFLVSISSSKQMLG